VFLSKGNYSKSWTNAAGEAWK